MKILINTPYLRLQGGGGVAGHYQGLKDYWTENIIYNTIGKRSRSNRFSAFFWLPIDIIKFVLRLIFYRPDVVVLNPSMAPNAVRRDMMYSKICRFFKLKPVIMFHGFNVNLVKTQETSIVKWLNDDALVVFVLSRSFREWLVNHGVEVPVELTTTKIDDRLLDNFELSKRTGKINSILFLARATKEKGLFIAIDVFRKLSELNNELRFTVVGNGPDWEEAKRRALDISDKIRFTGELHGNELVKEFVNNDLYLFTSYYEGMPASVLEAMAFGLPVVSRPVGALLDFFREGEMGYLVNSVDPEDFIGPICSLIDSPNISRNMSYINYAYVKKHYYASKVAQDFEALVKFYSK